MLKTYRKRFIILNMCLIGMALLSALIAVTVYTVHIYTDELEKTMMQVLEPIGSLPSGTDSKEENGPSKNDGDSPEKDNPPERPDRKSDEKSNEAKGTVKNKRERNTKIVTVRYYSDTDEYSIRSYDLKISEDSLKEAAEFASSQEEKFGKLPGYRLYYCRNTNSDGYSVALTHISYFHNDIIKFVIILLGIFIAAMTLFYILSFKLSKIAAKPLEKTMLLEKQFVADVSHQLKTPLTVILANNSIIKENPSSSISEQMGWIDSTDSAAKKMMDLVENMLTLSSVEFAGQKVTEEKCDLSAVVTKAALQMESVAFEKGIHPEINIEEGISVVANLEYLHTICRGLIDNALKYEPDGGSISISLYSKKKNCILCVHNKGSVIPGEDVPHVFERFYRSSNVKNAQSGYGLGLAIVKEMTEKSKGTISVQSTKESGTLFTVIFPISQ